MKQLYQYYAHQLGERPTLLLTILVLLGGLLIYRLIYFVLKAGRGLFDLTLEQSACLMCILIALVCGVLIWRVQVAHRRLRGMVLAKYRDAIEGIDSKARTTIKDLAGRLGMKKNMYKKFLRLIMLTPSPFIMLILFLLCSNFLTYLAVKYLPHGPGYAGTIWEDVYVNCPWAIATLVCIYLVYNDITVLENLKREVNFISVKAFADFFVYINDFKNKLTKTELPLVENWVRHVNLTDKEIAALMGITDTIKTHRYNILKKWESYSEENKIGIPLEKLLFAFYSE